MKNQKTIAIESYRELARINNIQEREIQKLRAQKTELEQQIEILKKFSILGEIFNEKKYIRNL